MPVAANAQTMQQFIDASNVAYNGLERMSLRAAEMGMDVPVHQALVDAERSLIKAVKLAKAQVK